MSSSARKRVAVIGGGISGLAAAHRLVELDAAIEPTLFEQSDRAGGLVQTVRRDGYLIEQSADNFITAVPWAIDLCRRLGLADQLIATTSGQQRGALVVRNGRLVRVPDGFVLLAPARLWPLVTTPLLSPWGKLRLLSEYFVPARFGAADESLASFASRRLGREAFERIVQPLVGGIYAADPARLSLRATLPRFLEMERRDGSLIRAARAARRAGHDDGQSRGARYDMFMTLRDGLAGLVEALVARLPGGSVRTGCRVAQLVPRENGSWRVSVDRGGASSAETFDAAIVACPAPAAARLVAPWHSALAAELAAIEYASTAIVSLAFSREQIGRPLDGFGFVVPAVERRPILAGSFSSIKFAGRAPDSMELVRVFIGGAGREDLVELPDDALRAMAADELARLLRISGPPALSEVVRWRHAMPQYHLGHCERVAAIESHVARWPRLALAGNAYAGVGIPHCIHSGEQAAARVVAELAR